MYIEPSENIDISNKKMYFMNFHMIITDIYHRPKNLESVKKHESMKFTCLKFIQYIL